MLNIGKLAHGGAEYYLTTVATSVEAYYTGAGEAPGRWLGSSAARLGLDGLVSAETLRTALAGADPVDGQPLVGHGRTVPGFDLTFRAPKSVLCRFRHSTEYADLPVMPRWFSKLADAVEASSSAGW
jgi:conjugative relaxase-like TrwC/TraI family protein